MYRTLKAQNDSCVVFELTEAIGTVAAFNSEKFSTKIMGGVSKALKAEKHDTSVVLKAAVREATKQGYAIGVDMANTLDTSCNQGIFVEISPELKVYAVWYPKKQCYIAIRKLTPKECFRLQGWTDDYFEKAEFVNSNSQLYKQAGNGVTVSVIEAIARSMT